VASTTVKSVATEQELCSTIINGLLLPEFVNLQDSLAFMKPAELNFALVSERMIVYARQKKVTELKRSPPPIRQLQLQIRNNGAGGGGATRTTGFVVCGLSQGSASLVQRVASSILLLLRRPRLPLSRMASEIAALLQTLKTSQRAPALVAGLLLISGDRAPPTRLGMAKWMA
jgi:hypothetical protein